MSIHSLDSNHVHPRNLDHRILIADAQQLFAQGLHHLLSGLPDFEVIGWGKDGREAVTMAGELEPDLVLMDLTMPNLNGIEATRRITCAIERVQVICLTTCSAPHLVIAALEAGANGYVLKDCSFEELERALRTVLARQTYLSPSVSGTVVKALRASRSTDDPAASSVLSEREREVLQLLAEGHSTGAISGCLHLSPKTVHSHRRRIMEKLGIRNLAGLVKFAVREGMTSGDA